MDGRWKRWLILAAAGLCVAGGKVGAQPLAEVAVPAPSPADAPLPPYVSYSAPSPGWFVQTEAGVSRPRITNLASDYTDTFLVDTAVHSANLDWGPAGEVGVGYRAEDANGFLLSFRGGSWTGHKTVPLTASGVDPWIFDPFGPDNQPSWDLHTRDLHTRLSFARLDLDYLGTGWAVGGGARVGWSVGVRAAWLGLSETADDSFTVTRTGFDLITGAPLDGRPTPELEHERASVSLSAGGVHLAVDGTWALGDTGWGLFASLDGGLLVAGHKDRYSSWGGDYPESYSESKAGFLATLNATAGVQYVLPCRRVTLRLSAGYQLEAWAFSTLDINFNYGGSSDLVKGLDWYAHGLFVRSVFEF